MTTTAPIPPITGTVTVGVPHGVGKVVGLRG
jgi:hypothetical protein